jgi:hypothetical protein
MSSPPRPILKQSHSSPHRSAHHHGVHFPPSPALTRTFTMHSAQVYDRSPISVSQNSCALPERGCPGRTYTLDDSSNASSCMNALQNGRVLHPRALVSNSNGRLIPMCRTSNADQEDDQRTATRTMPPLPALIPDLSSESDESDSYSYSPGAFYSTPPSNASFPVPKFSLHDPSIPNQHQYGSYTNFEFIKGPTSPAQLSFLPHPPSHPNRAPLEEDAQKPSRRRERRRDRSRSRSRERDRDAVRQSREDPDACLSSSPRKSRQRSSPIHIRTSSFSCDESDIGCLGGF